MKKTYIVYREGDAGTEEHLAIVHAANCLHMDATVQVPVFVDDKGRLVLRVMGAWDNKVREVGVEP